jgi:hypothetical protein
MACHCEGSTRSKSVPKAKPAEESPVQAGWKNQFWLDATKKNRPCLWKRKIPRRPITTCQKIKFVVGLLRMTNLNTWSVP